MKREILFRAKRLDNGEWVEGSLVLCRMSNTGAYIVENPERGHSMPQFTSDTWCTNSLIPADPATIGQYTGLKDNNGVRIFEGDVVKWDDCSDGRYWRVAGVKIDPDLQFKCLDSFNGLEGSAKGHTFRFGNFIYKDTEHHLYIIGTIHDNPELAEA